MSFFQEYSLLFAVATPVAVLLAMNVGLWIAGERHTLMLPGLMSFPKVTMDDSVPMPVDISPVVGARTAAVAANDGERVAA